MNGAILALLEQQLETQKALLESQKVVSQERPIFGSHSVGQAPESDVPKTATEVVREHLKAHPEDRALPLRKLAEKLNVGKSTVDRVLKE